jgi:membrane peptidoglycan carboxypeptidase
MWVLDDAVAMSILSAQNVSDRAGVWFDFPAEAHHVRVVTDTPPNRPPLTHAERARVEREARQAAALRANLRRRKAQERGREAPLPEAEPSEPAPDKSAF